MKYDTLRQLHDAIQAGEVKDAAIGIDNDVTAMYAGGKKVFEMHPADLLEQALDLLGIPHEHV
jgi:hypothetical protein